MRPNTPPPFFSAARFKPPFFNKESIWMARFLSFGIWMAKLFWHPCICPYFRSDTNGWQLCVWQKSLDPYPARPGSKAFALTAFCIQTLRTRDQRATVSSLTGVTASCHWARHINPSIVLVQPRKTRPYVTERLLTGTLRIKSNKQNKHRESGAVPNFVSLIMFDHVPGCLFCTPFCFIV